MPLTLYEQSCRSGAALTFFKYALSPVQASMAVLSANPAHPELSRFYVHTMRSVGKRLVLRMYVDSHLYYIHSIHR